MTVAGDGTPMRQFIYSDDLARIMHWSFKNYKDLDRPISCCPPDSEVSISDIVKCITGAFEFTGEVKYDTAQPNGHFKKTVDHTHLASLDHGIEFTPLDEGVKKSVEWFKNSLDIARV
jgi:GDP-L-fucose synthase